MQNLENVDWSVNEHVVTLTLNNAPVNALSEALIDNLTRAMDTISELDDIHAVILTSAGHVFCAGADLKNRDTLIKEPGDLPRHSRRMRELFHAIRECEKPIVGALNGPALGAGLAIAASCDVLVASELASLGLPEIDVGLFGGASHAMRLFGHSRLRRMVLTGMRVAGAELYRLGVVEACVSADELMPTAIRLAQEIAAKSPLASRIAKQTLNAIEDMTLRDGYRFEQDVTSRVSGTEDAREAQNAFREKRKPIFRGR